MRPGVIRSVVVFLVLPTAAVLLMMSAWKSWAMPVSLASKLSVTVLSVPFAAFVVVTAVHEFRLNRIMQRHASTLYDTIAGMRHIERYLHHKHAWIYFVRHHWLQDALFIRVVAVDVPMWADADHKDDWNPNMPRIYLRRVYSCTSDQVKERLVPWGPEHPPEPSHLSSLWRNRRLRNIGTLTVEEIDELVTLLREAEPAPYEPDDS